MPLLALRLAEQRNAVSELHGQVARRMWNFLWPELPEEQVPITHITNGVHTGTWLARRLRNQADRYLGNGWLETPTTGHLGAHRRHPDAELTSAATSSALVHYAKRCEQWFRTGVHQCRPLPPACCSTLRPDHWLCLPLRHLQALA
jgi:starch phosphorylase